MKTYLQLGREGQYKDKLIDVFYLPEKAKPERFKSAAACMGGHVLLDNPGRHQGTPYAEMKIGEVRAFTGMTDLRRVS